MVIRVEEIHCLAHFDDDISIANQALVIEFLMRRTEFDWNTSFSTIN